MNLLLRARICCLRREYSHPAWHAVSATADDGRFGAREKDALCGPRGAGRLHRMEGEAELRSLRWPGLDLEARDPRELPQVGRGEPEVEGDRHCGNQEVVWSDQESRHAELCPEACVDPCFREPELRDRERREDALDECTPA